LKLEISKERFSLEITDPEELRYFAALTMAIFYGGKVDIIEAIHRLVKGAKEKGQEKRQEPQAPPSPDTDEKIRDIKIE